jgi:hypothetical protein
MKQLNRNIGGPAAAHHPANHTQPANQNEFCVCRVIEDCALIKIESLNKLHAAKKYMRRVALHFPGSYVVFSHRSKRVLGKVISHAAAEGGMGCTLEMKLTA